MSLLGKVALVTGASSGIGAATAIQLAKLGASVSLTGRNLENLQATASKCDGASPLIIQGDVAKEEDCSRIVAQTVEKFGRLDVLVNNAGVLEMGTIETTSLEQYDR